MIGRIRGVLLEKEAPNLLLEASGVGYELQAPMSTFYKLPNIGQEVTLHTHFVVREDAQALYGFISKDERSLFRNLIKISGVGPKLALTILSGVDPDMFVRCIMDNDVSSLVRLPGVGKKTAERLLVEMRGKLKAWDTSATFTGTTSGSSNTKDALNALISLGYKPHEVSRVLSKYKDQDLSSEELIRLVLKSSS